MTQDPIITCPNCKSEIKLNESLAAPLIEATRREYEQRIAHKDAAIAKRELLIHERENEVSKAREKVDQLVAEKLREERSRIAAEESEKAKLAFVTDIEQKTQEVKSLYGVIEQNNKKLAEAQQAQAELIRKQRDLDDARRELELTVEKRVQEGLGKTRDQARKEAEENLGLKVAEKEQTIASMQKQIEELKRRAEQGSQQLQGEVQELQLESLLLARFPRDTFDPVP